IDYASERKKPRLLAILFCDFSNSTEHGKANLLGIFDRIYVHPDNKMTPKFILYVRTAETIPGSVEITILNPEGKSLGSMGYDANAVEFTPNLPAQMQLVLPFSFIAEVEGVYWFNVSYNEETIGGAGLV